jgi:predicted nucleotide-binding protein
VHSQVAHHSRKILYQETKQKMPTPTELTVSIDKFKKDLSTRIEIGEEIQNRKIINQQEFEQNREDYYQWNDYNSEFLKQSFSNENNEYKDRYDKCSMFIGFTNKPQTPNSKLLNFKESVKAKVVDLKKLLAKTDLLKSSIKSNGENIESRTLSSNIFIVHGHDERIKLDTARTIEKLGLKPIILSEQPNQGQTIIEKFELHSDVGFAVILLTADDLGKVKTDTEEKYRARQNVIIEMGYFIGKLGRSKVFPLYEEGVELPSDLHGVLYIPLDDSGSWKFKLAKELNAAGYNVKANNIL